MKRGVFILLFLGLIVSSAFAMGAPPPGHAAPNLILSFLPFIIVVAVSVMFIGKNRARSSLVLKEFELNEDNDEFLQITGRAAGALGWVLAQIGIDPVTSLSCNREAIKFEEAAIKTGKTTMNIPLVAITGVCSGISKPFFLLVFGVVSILGGIILASVANSVGLFFLGLIVGAVCLVFYYLRKTMQFEIYAGGDKPIAAISIKKSIIEGQDINEARYEAAANAIIKAVLEIKK